MKVKRSRKMGCVRRQGGRMERRRRKRRIRKKGSEGETDINGQGKEDSEPLSVAHL